MTPQPQGSSSFLDRALRMLSVLALIAASVYVIAPFISILVWSVVLTIALYPMHKGLREYQLKRFRVGSTLSALLIIASTFLLIIIPSIWLLTSTAMTAREFIAHLNTAGGISIPPPDPRLLEWPVVGSFLHGIWLRASTDLPGLLLLYEKQWSALLIGIASSAGGAAVSLVYFMIALALAGFLLHHSTGLERVARGLLKRLSGHRSEEIAALMVNTVQGVMKSVVVVSILQALLAGIGFVVAGIPLAGIWTAVCLILAVMQVGVLPVAIGTIIYAWLNFGTTGALLFTVWMLFIGIIDNLIKPFLMGQEGKTPVAIVFFGSIGGFIGMGFIGLFIGAVLLAVAYELMMDWAQEKA